MYTEQSTCHGHMHRLDANGGEVFTCKVIMQSVTDPRALCFVLCASQRVAAMASSA